jgi:hypothetical protein
LQDEEYPHLVKLPPNLSQHARKKVLVPIAQVNYNALKRSLDGTGLTNAEGGIVEHYDPYLYLAGEAYNNYPPTHLPR